jgi:hypothetical protein
MSSRKNLSREEVFGDIVGANFAAGEAAEYLEVSVLTFRRYVQAKKSFPIMSSAEISFLQRRPDRRALKDVKRH